MKILHVIASLGARTGGPAKACLDMARAVARRGHDVTILTTTRALAPGEGESLQSWARAAGVALTIFPQQWPQTLATSWPLAAALDRTVPGMDVVHLHSLYLFHDWAAARACRRAGVPYLLRPHGTLDPYLWRRSRWKKAPIEWLFQNRVLREAAAIHYTAEEEGRLAAPYVQGAPGVVIPNGINPEDYAALPAPGGFRARHPEIGGRRILLFLSRLNFKKGLDVLIPAFARAGLPDWQLVLAGPDDGMEPQARAWAAEHGIADRVSFPGMLVGADKLAAFRDAEAFVLPSYSENFGIAIVEAMACGLPVLISDRVNIWREIEAAGAGAVAPPEVTAFAVLIAGLAADPARAQAMGAAGRTLATTVYAWDRIAAELEAVYARVAAARATRKAA